MYVCLHSIITFTCHFRLLCIVSVFQNFLCAFVAFETSSLVVCICVMYEKMYETLMSHQWLEKADFSKSPCLNTPKPSTHQQLVWMPLEVWLQVSRIDGKNLSQAFLSAERWHVLIFYIYHSTTLKFCNKLYECGKRWFSFWGGFSCFILPFQANVWNAVMALCTVHSQRSSDVYPGVWRCFLKFVYLQTALTSFQNNFKSVLPIS